MSHSRMHLLSLWNEGSWRFPRSLIDSASDRRRTNRKSAKGCASHSPLGPSESAQTGVLLSIRFESNLYGMRRCHKWRSTPMKIPLDKPRWFVVIEVSNRAHLSPPGAGTCTTGPLSRARGEHFLLHSVTTRFNRTYRIRKDVCRRIWGLCAHHPQSGLSDGCVDG